MSNISKYCDYNRTFSSVYVKEINNSSERFSKYKVFDAHKITQAAITESQQPATANETNEKNIFTTSINRQIELVI